MIHNYIPFPTKIWQLFVYIAGHSADQQCGRCIWTAPFGHTWPPDRAVVQCECHGTLLGKSIKMKNHFVARMLWMLMPVFQCCRRQKRFCPKWLRMIEDTLPRSPRWPAMWALANWSITVQVNSQRWVCFIYPIPCSPPLYHELSIITGWLWWGFEAGAGSPWTYEHPNHLHLPLLHPGHWHVRRRECQVSAIQRSNDPTIQLLPFHENWHFDLVNDCRWVPTLNPNDVADRVIAAIRKNEKLAVIPGFLKILLSFKWYVNKWTFAPALIMIICRT